MLELRIIELVLGIVTLICSGGWFVYYRLNKQLKRVELDRERLSVYKTILDDVEPRVERLQKKIIELEAYIEKLKTIIHELKNKN